LLGTTVRLKELKELKEYLRGIAIPIVVGEAPISLMPPLALPNRRILLAMRGYFS